MKKILKYNKYIHYSIIIIIGIILSIPLIKVQFVNTHDGYFHLLKLISTINTLNFKNIPPLIVPYIFNYNRICYEFIL